MHEKTTALPCRLPSHFERDTGKQEENQDPENFRKPPTGGRTELVALSPKEKRVTGGNDNLVEKKVNLLCRHFR